MAILRRSAGREKAEQQQALVAVVGQSLPATLPVEQSCADLYVRLYPRLFRVAKRSLGSDGARDVIHDVFLSLWRRWDKLTPDERNDAVVTTAVKNKVVDVVRRDRRSIALTPQMEETGEVPAVAPLDAEVELADVKETILAQLSPRCREVYLLVNIDGFTYKQVAAALDIGYESVRTYLKRANILIREALTDGGYNIAAGTALKALPGTSEASDE
jgi:RNA polymerase sigma-70 factor (ECF subfamily)